MLESVKKHWDLYKEFFQIYLKTKLIYKTDFVLGMLNQMFSLFSSLLLIGLIFTQVESINGWGFYELVFLVGVARFMLNAHIVFFFSVVFLGESFIVTGRLDRFFIRPLNILYQVYANHLNLHNLGDAIASFMIIVYAALQLNVQFITPVKIAYSLMAVVSGIMLLAGLFLIFATFGFWTGRTKSLFNLFWNLKRFNKYPYGIYSRALKIFFITVMPVMFASFFPASFLLEKFKWIEMQLFTLIAGPIFYIIAYQFWKYGLSHYSSTGS